MDIMVEYAQGPSQGPWQPYQCCWVRAQAHYFPSGSQGPRQAQVHWLSVLLLDHIIAGHLQIQMIIIFFFLNNVQNKSTYMSMHS